MRQRFSIAPWVLLAIFGLLQSSACAENKTAENKAAETAKSSASTKKTEKPKLSRRAMVFPEIEFETTQGTFTVALHGGRAPITVQNFVQYVLDGHYNGTVFHRVIPNFMAQAGGYDKDLAEKPVKNPIVNESGNGFQNLRGSIAMARTNNPHSATAQFFINLVDNTNLDPSPKRWGYTVFGEVTKGMEVLDKIAAIPTAAKGSFRSDVPTETVTIIEARIINK